MDILERLSSSKKQPVEAIAVTLANELDLLDGEFVLVLDDYHWIHDAAIHQLLIELLTYPPRSLHLVITAAADDPPTPWNLRTCSLFASGVWTISASRRRKQPNSWQKPGTALVSPPAGRILDGAVGRLGYGLRLAALSIDHEPTSASPALVAVGRRSIANYFASEIIKQLSDSSYRLLMRTSILDTLTGELCDFVVGNPQPEQRAADELRRLEACWRLHHCP